ncbi:MAG TPA: hypothetical protein PK406_14635 [Verrucomicrobiota bacterium]|nr:hypothetical protein [Verrucomicrobiota bacterium]
MLLIIEIALMVVSWRRGWRWWALAPLTIALGIAASMGLMAGTSGLSISENEFALLLLPLDGVVCVTLILMATTKPRGPQGPPQPPMAAPDFKLP